MSVTNHHFLQPVEMRDCLPESRILKNSRFITEIATSITFNHTGKYPGEQVVFLIAIKGGKFNPQTRPACPDLAGPRLSSRPACYLPAIALAQARRTGRHIAMAGRFRRLHGLL
jgi:hypothetical protein